MADTPTTQTWHSGDWESNASSTPPYNGIEITGLPQYDDHGAFISAAITIMDYTKNQHGVSSVIPALTTAQGQFMIPVPSSDSAPSSGDQTNTSDDTSSTETASQDDTASKTGTGTDSTQNGTVSQDTESTNTDVTSPSNDSTHTESTDQQDNSTASDTPNEPNPDFTVNGWISLETSFSYVHLRVNFHYGLDSHQRDELGYVMIFNTMLESAD